MSEPRLLLKVGAEGGYIAVYGNPDDATKRYRVGIVDQTPSFLAADEAGPQIRRDSGWLTTWEAAVEALNRWPWPRLVPLHIDPAMHELVLQAVAKYVGDSPPLFRARCLHAGKRRAPADAGRR